MKTTTQSSKPNPGRGAARKRFVGGNRGIGASLERGTAYGACLIHDPTDSRSTGLLLILFVIMIVI